jgi:hypothetical protein
MHSFPSEYVNTFQPANETLIDQEEGEQNTSHEGGTRLYPMAAADEKSH